LSHGLLTPPLPCLGFERPSTLVTPFQLGVSEPSVSSRPSFLFLIRHRFSNALRHSLVRSLDLDWASHLIFLRRDAVPTRRLRLPLLSAGVIFRGYCHQLFPRINLMPLFSVEGLGSYEGFVDLFSHLSSPLNAPHHAFLLQFRAAGPVQQFLLPLFSSTPLLNLTVVWTLPPLRSQSLSVLPFRLDPYCTTRLCSGAC